MNFAMDIPYGDVKFRINKFQTVRGHIDVTFDDEYLEVDFKYDRKLVDEFRSMDTAKWMGRDKENPRKVWMIRNSDHNRFRLAFLMDMNPYAPYNGKLPPFIPRRRKPDGTPKPYDHQLEMASHILVRRQCIIAGEMGTGKTLSAMEAMEQSGFGSHEWLWVGPRSALDSVRYEFRKWRVCDYCGKLGMHHQYEDHPIFDSKIINPRFATYEEVKKIIKEWPAGVPAYKGLIADEASRVKTAAAQRTVALKYLADNMRSEWKRDAIITLMSGSPAPKDPTDWWSLCNIACPGFLKEGSQTKLKYRLCKIDQYEGTGGVSFPKMLGWYDDENKCKKCLKAKNHGDHDVINSCEQWYHDFEPSINEVRLLYQRASGLVNVKLKKDCLDLPDKIYKRIICKPNPSTLRAASLISKTSISTIRALTLLRELSDGFQYREVEKGVDTCDQCHGRLVINAQIDLDEPDLPLDEESLTKGHRAVWQEDMEAGGYNLKCYLDRPLRVGVQEVPCYYCNGKGTVPRYERESVRVDCPKDQAVEDLLDMYEEEGRTVFWAGFTESVDRVTQLLIKAGWGVMRLDGRGWYCNVASTASGPELLELFDNKHKLPKVGFVGQPGAGGMGLNLTASSMECYYSNTFKGEDRAQSEDRIHRPGADHNRGCTIYDLIHLPQDIWVLDSVKKKLDLQYMSMGYMAKNIRDDFTPEELALAS